MGNPTTPAPEEKSLGASAPCVPGTIGFDIYLAVYTSRAALAVPRVPQDLGKLLDYRA